MIGTRQYRRIEALGAPNEETHRPSGAKPPLQVASQLLAVRRGTTGIEHYNKGPVGQCGEQRLAFSPLHFARRTATFRDLGQGKSRPQPPVVARKQLGLGTGAQPANGDQTQHR